MALSPVRVSHVVVARATIHRSVLARLERDFGVDATCSADGRKHAPAGAKAPIAAATAASTSFLLPCHSAIWAALGVVGEAFGSKELLLASTKGKADAAIRALQFPIGETHWMTSFLKNCGASVIQYLEKPCLGETFAGATLRGC